MVLLAGGALGFGACASTDPNAETGVLSSAISGGTVDQADSNVFLLVSHRGKEGVALCTASLIAPNLLLTARHCVSDVTSEQVICGKTMASAPFMASSFYATNALSIDDASTSYRVSSIAVPPGGNDICGYDIALVTLATSVPSSIATPLVPRIDEPVVSHEGYSAVGYGLTDPGDAGVAGQRRARGGLLVDCAPGKCGQGVQSNEFVGDTGICSGDSGGPALDDAGKVVGVVSRSGNDCAHPVYASVAAWKAWLSSVATEAAAAGNYTPPFWVTSGLSDPPVDAGVLGVQGDTCAVSADCQAAFACFSATSEVGDAYCAAHCAKSADCPAGTTCRVGVLVCVAGPAANHGSSSCSVSQVAKPSWPGGAAATLALLALAWLARRSRWARLGS